MCLNFIVLALVPLALAGIGAHLAGAALDNPKRRNTLLLVWGIAGLGLIFAAVQQVQAYNSDEKHDHEQQKIQTRLDDTKGQLTSLVVVMSTLVTSLPKSGNVGQDVSKAWAAALSLAIAQVAKNAQTQPQPAQLPQPLPMTSALSLTNLELKRNVNFLAGRFFGFDSSTMDRLESLIRVGAAGAHKNEFDKEAAKQNILGQRNIDFAPLRAQALILRTTLLSRLPPQPTDHAVNAVLDDGNYSAGSATTIANHLLKLASLLPDK